jgi:hypothetical protein
MKNGKKKLAYGENPEDALNILAVRLTPAEMEEIYRDRYTKIIQRDLQQYTKELG